MHRTASTGNWLKLILFSQVGNTCRTAIPKWTQLFTTENQAARPITFFRAPLLFSAVTTHLTYAIFAKWILQTLYHCCLDNIFLKTRQKSRKMWNRPWLWHRWQATMTKSLQMTDIVTIWYCDTITTACCWLPWLSFFLFTAYVIFNNLVKFHKKQIILKKTVTATVRVKQKN